MNASEKYLTTENWKVYKIRFEDGFEYVGITKYSVPDRIRRHVQAPINAELSRRIIAEQPYLYTVLHDEIKDVSEAHRLESQEIRELEKPINISGVDPEKAVHFGHPQTPENIRRRLRHTSKRTRDVYPPRKGRYMCSICRVKKEHTEFQQDRSRFNGLNSRCKSCGNERYRRRKAHLPYTADDIRDAIKTGEVVEVPPHYIHWTEAEEEILRRSNGKPARELAEMLGRTPNAVREKRRRLGISSSRPHNKWTPAEKQELLALVKSGMKRKDIAETLGRTYASVSGMLRRLNKDGK